MRILFSKLNVKFLLVLITAIMLNSCGSGDKLDVDVSDIDLTIKVKRFDKDLKSAFEKGESEVYKLSEKYNDFFELFNINLINIGPSEDTGYYGRLKDFMDYYLVKEAFEEVNRKFPDNKYIEEKLTQAFKHFRYYYPDKEIPEIVAYISGFNLSVATSQNTIAISLDKYLGKDYELYRSMGFSNYLIPNMKKESIAPDCMQALAYNLFPFVETKSNLLEYMIYEGKIKYFVEAMMPDEDDAIIMGYSDKEIKWCKDSEKNMWNYLLDYKQLFVSEMMTIKKYIGEGPFTINFSKESPGKAGVWLGWQIIRKYMEENKDLGLQELMENNDYQGILNDSGYNP